MINKTFLYGHLLLLFLCALGVYARAQQEPVYVDPLVGDSIHTGKKMTVKDSVFFDPVLKPTIKNTYSINNLISLKINENTNKVLPDSFALSVKIKVIYVAPDTLSDSIAEKTLSINYYKNKPYQDKAVFYFQGAHFVEAQILDISSTYADTSVVLPLVQMENRMVINRDFVMNCTSDAISSINQDTSTISTSGELKISWQPSRVSQLYDVEWTFLDQSAIDNGRYTGSNNQLDPKSIFKNNATRITTRKTNYTIPLLYDGEGTLFYRIRGVEQDINGELTTTQWSSESNPNPDQWKYVFDGHQRNLNWQATTSFAEDGKRKSVVQYFDGSLRARQVVTMDNTSQTTVVAETLYDKQGRPVIQVMPAPTLNKLISYTPYFNVANMNGSEYDKDYYDPENSSGVCGYGADSMSVVSGTSNYYSPLNSLASTGYNQYIPDARGYAFSETQYTQDNTGRIYRQSGVDSFFRIGSGRETKYYYSTPDQTDLDALFGTEVGDASHYQKNMVRDANGQYSVSYVDMHGRTIATALAGTPPAGLQALPSYKIDSLQTEQLLTPTNNVLNGSAIEFSKAIVMTKNDSVSFHYSLGKQSLKIADCKNDSICYDCLYDLVITITGDCVNQVSNSNSAVYTFSNFPLWKVDTTCGLATPIDTVFKVYLTEGSYTVSKKLSISSLGRDKYRDSVYLPRNTCIAYDSLYRVQMNAIKAGLSCSDDTYNAPSYLFYRDQILEDLYPLLGQYADTAEVRSCLSIFDKDGEKYKYQTVVTKYNTVYKDQDGNIDYVENAQGNLVRPEELTPEEFITYFKPSWAEALLPLHPEYKLWLEYERLSASHTWDDDFEETETYQQAVAKGYLNPTGSSAAPANKFLAGTDPLYALVPSSAKQIIEDSLFHFIIGKMPDPQNPDLTLWGLATIMAECGEPVSDDCAAKWNKAINVFNTDSLCAGELDMAWRFFRDMYLEKKREWEDKYIRDIAGIPYPQSPCEPVFPRRDLVLAEGGFNEWDKDQNVNSGNSSKDAVYSGNCDSYKDQWRSELDGSCYTEQQKDTIIKYLLEVCKEGSDDTHPYGSSTVKPSSTYQFKSFKDVFSYVNSTITPSPSISCNAYLIDKPFPYDQQTFVLQQQVWSKPDSCTCEKINTLYTDYSSSSGYTDFSDYIEKTLHTTISEGALDSLRGLCSGEISCKFIPAPITIPPALQCGNEGVCISCEEYQTAYNDFKTLFPSLTPSYEEDDTTQGSTNRIFANFMNQRFGFSKTAVEYLSFGSDCNLSGGGGLIDTLNNYVRDFKTLYKDYYDAKSKGQTYKQYKITPAAIAMVEAANALVKARNGLPLPQGYALMPYNSNYTAKLRSIANTVNNDSSYNTVLPLALPYTSQTREYPSLLNNTVLASDFVAPPVTQQQLSEKYYATSFGIYNNWFRNIWSKKNHTDFAYYGFSTPLLKYVPDASEDPAVNDIYATTFYKIDNTVSDPGTFFSYYNNNVRVSNVFTSAACNYSDVTSIANLRFATEFLPFSNMSTFTNTAVGLKVTLTMKDGTEQDAYWYSPSNYDSYLQFKEALDTNQYNPDCRSAFTYYFNQQRGSSYTAAQLDSFYLTTTGSLPNVCGDTSATSCSDLEQLVNSYYYEFINPASRVVELDMRTFAGNKTPEQGPKGVFNVEGKLIGNTIDGTLMQINSSFALIWNSDSANQHLGTLTASDNGKFELYLNPSKQAPANGIIGMRYYQFTTTSDTLDALGCGIHCYINFGDGTYFNTGSDTSNALSKVYTSNSYGEQSPYMESNIMRHYSILHTFIQSGSKTITVYHPDVKGYVGFDNITSGAGYNLTKLTGLKGYFPQDVRVITFHSTQDSTFNNTDSIFNFSQISTIEGIDVGNGTSNALYVFKNNRFGSFENNHNLRFIWTNQSDVRTVDQFTPNWPENFPELRFIRLEKAENLYSSDVDFTLPKVDFVALIGSLTTVQIDSIIIQIARGTTKQNGYLAFSLSNGAQRSSASDVAVTTLIAKNWSLHGAGLSTNNTIATYPAPVDQDSVLVTNGLTDYISEQLGVQLSYNDLNNLFLSKCGHAINMDSIQPAAATLTLCGKTEPMNEFVDYQPDPCADSTNLAIAAATQLYEIYQDSIKGNFDEAYNKKCLSVGALESFSITRPVSEYHYTLYYYDQAGNLVKTIPPKAVQPNRDAAWLAQVAEKRALGEDLVPSHATDPLVTTYRYNSLNQVVSQRTPDGGMSGFWYDRLGRLVISQNAKQTLANNYSYTTYDAIGRIIEVGEKYQDLGISQTITRDPLQLKKWIQYKNFDNAYQPRAVTYTLYDIPDPYGDEYYFDYTPFRQKAYTLRNRVSMNRYYAGRLGQRLVINAGDTTYSSNYWWPSTGIVYSYDIHGNVDSLLNIAWDGSFMRDVDYSFGYRYIAYKYDLISGKVNEVHYQGSNAQFNFADEFYHRYEYDAENRLTDVYSTDNRAFLGQQGLEEHDAHYEYYKHGPLARVVLGDQQVQGVDYAYTLQGWLKGINSTSLNSNFDMGEDGKPMSANKNVARDAYGFNLNYFTNEYSAISGAMPFPGHTAYMPANTYKPLYNGNISSIAVNIGKLNQPQLYNYGYDQLNRLISMDVYRGLNQSDNGNNWNALAASNDYKERIAYDGNGNILKYLRQGNGSALNMDSLTYNYNAGTNQLNYIKDQVASTAYANTDIDNQSANNYTYDAIGNLLTDNQERVTGTTWNVYGKITDVTRSFAAHKTASTHFQYDPTGSRVGKIISTFYEGDRKYWYVKDAQGNVMAVYYSETDSDWHNGPVRLQEQHLYGSSRLGIVKKDFDIKQSKATPVNANLLGPTYVYTTTRGSKVYELTNHLGNVLATVSDRKIGHVNGSTYDYYDADVVSASDYYPFGMEMPARTFSSPLYRYGFNGKERDDEAKGSGEQYDYGFRIYDPRAGRFLSVDPLTRSYPMLTPYQFASNSPIANIDLDGLESAPANRGSQEGQREITTRTITPSSSSADADNPQTIDKAWYWHNGGLTQNKKQEKVTKTMVDVLSEPGWYSAQEYQKILQGSASANGSIAKEMAGYLGLYSNAGGHNWTSEEKANVGNTQLGKFLSGVADDAMNQIVQSAQSFANSQNFKVSGFTAPSSFNVEDMVGIGLALKYGLKALLTKEARNTGTFLEKTVGAASGTPKATWIKHDVWNKLKELGLQNKFNDAMEKGFAPTRSGSTGIIRLTNNEVIRAGDNIYNFKIKILGKGASHYRLYGRTDENGAIIFDLLKND